MSDDWRDDVFGSLTLHGLKMALVLQEDGAYHNRANHSMCKLLVAGEWQIIHCMYVQDEVEIIFIGGQIRTYPLDHIFECKIYDDVLCDNPIKWRLQPDTVVSKFLVRGSMGNSYVSPKHSIILYDDMIIARAIVDDEITLIDVHGHSKRYERYDMVRPANHYKFM